MNNFPAMTEEQRQLAGLCKIEIKRWQAASESNPNMRYMVELMEIALAALTAEPVGWMVKYGGIDKEMFVDKQAAARLYHDVTENGFLDVDMLQLYTAPPAPVLRVPDGWIKCSEQMPEDDTLCLGFDVEGIIWTAHYDCGFLTPDCGADDVVFTHWMPLPSPPEASNEQ